MTEKPLIALDLRPAQSDGVGVATVGQQMLKHLNVLKDRFRFLLVFDGTLPTDHLPLPPYADVLLTTVGRSDRFRRDFHDQVTLPRRLKKAGVALYHNIDFGGPIFPVPYAVVSSFLDAIAFDPIDERAELVKLRLRALLHLVARRADAIVTISDHALGELSRCIPAVRGKIHRIWCSLDDAYFAPPQPDALASCNARLGGRKGFVLYYGGFTRRKNTRVIIDALKACPPDIHLVIAGGGNGPKKMAEQAQELGIGDRVHLFGFASIPELRALLSLCSVSVFPSLLEGFGLPAAEAMAAGTPVISSTSSSLPEIAGDAVEYFPPTDSKKLAEILARVMGSPTLRAAMVLRGIKRANEHFTGARAMSQYGDLYAQVLAQRA